MSWKEKPSFKRDMEELKRTWGPFMAKRGIDPDVMFEQIVARLTALGHPLDSQAPHPDVIRAVVNEVYNETVKKGGDA